MRKINPLPVTHFDNNASLRELIIFFRPQLRNADAAFTIEKASKISEFFFVRHQCTNPGSK
jgi:hypothetical protein